MRKDKISIFTDKHINFTVDIPETEQERHAGLTYLKEIPNNFGMLYYIPRRQIMGFHTKDTPWSVDFIFIDWCGNIQEIATAKPFSEEMYTVPNACAVLEIKGGECKRLDIQEGDTVFYSGTKITKNNEFLFDKFPFKKINHRNFNEVSYDNLYFVAFAEGGAMGWAGSMEFLTKENDKIKTYMIDSTSLNFEECIETIFPPIKYFNCGVAGIGTEMKHPDWKWVDMGFGNHLFVRSEVYDVFIREMQSNFSLDKGMGTKCTPGYVYENWAYFGWGILKYGKISKPRRNTFGYTISNPIPLSKIKDEQHLLCHLRYEKGEILSFHREDSIISEQTNSPVDAWSLLIKKKGKMEKIYLFMDPNAFKPWRLPNFEEMKLPDGFSFVPTNKRK